MKSMESVLMVQEQQAEVFPSLSQDFVSGCQRSLPPWISCFYLCLVESLSTQQVLNATLNSFSSLRHSSAKDSQVIPARRRMGLLDRSILHCRPTSGYLHMNERSSDLLIIVLFRINIKPRVRFWILMCSCLIWCHLN